MTAIAHFPPPDQASVIDDGVRLISTIGRQPRWNQPDATLQPRVWHFVWTQRVTGVLSLLKQHYELHRHVPFWVTLPPGNEDVRVIWSAGSLTTARQSARFGTAEADFEEVNASHL